MNVGAASKLPPGVVNPAEPICVVQFTAAPVPKVILLLFVIVPWNKFTLATIIGLVCVIVKPAVFCIFKEAILVNTVPEPANVCAALPVKFTKLNVPEVPVNTPSLVNKFPLWEKPPIPVVDNSKIPLAAIVVFPLAITVPEVLEAWNLPCVIKTSPLTVNVPEVVALKIPVPPITPVAKIVRFPWITAVVVEVKALIVAVLVALL